MINLYGGTMPLKDEHAPDERGNRIIQLMAEKYLLTTFQFLNKELNKQGLCLSVMTLDEAGFPEEDTIKHPITGSVWTKDS
jgi:hypothetical protein